MTIIIFIMTLAFIIIIQSAIPFLLKRTIVFGVSIPEPNTGDHTLSSYKRMYAGVVFTTGSIALIVYLLWALMNPLSEEQLVLTGLAIQMGTLLLSMVLYLYFHMKTMKLKRSEQWGSDRKYIRIADLQSHAKDEMLPWFMYVIPMLVTVGLIVYTASQYSLLPDMIPTHWGPSGQPDAFSEKSPFSSVALLLILFIIQAMMIGVNIAIKKSGIKLTAKKKKTSQLQQIAVRKYTSWFLLLLSVFVTILIGFFQLTTIHEGFQNPSLMLALPLVFLIVILIATGIYAFKVGQGGSRIAISVEEEESIGSTDTDDDHHWKFGVFYVNRQDPSIFIEKRFGIGWGINFGNPLGYLLLFLPILLILLIAIFL